MSDPTEPTPDPADLLHDEPRRHPIVWLVYAALYAIAIPWYWPQGAGTGLVFGIPLWAAVTLLAVVALAGWTAYVIHRYWHESSA